MIMRKQLSKSDIKKINQEIESSYGVADFFDKKANVELVKEEFEVVTLDKEPCFFYLDKQIIPTLKLLLKNNFLKKVTIDMGAVKFIASGADLMRPGITEIEEGIEKDDFISIIDENNKKPIAIGQAMMNSEEMKATESGKVIKNIHYVGDKLWKQ
ncbi:DUF1947 domain-containing protein [Candidatus Woesearchaeota archaeon]|nr:DUF1947 domain-containing protein [Candidatus Woesearchaeota archaeon]